MNLLIPGAEAILPMPLPEVEALLLDADGVPPLVKIAFAFAIDAVILSIPEANCKAPAKPDVGAFAGLASEFLVNAEIAKAVSTAI